MVKLTAALSKANLGFHVIPRDHSFPATPLMPLPVDIAGKVHAIVSVGRHLDPAVANPRLWHPSLNHGGALQALDNIYIMFSIH
jgi:hypothetical protein